MEEDSETSSELYLDPVCALNWAQRIVEFQQRVNCELLCYEIGTDNNSNVEIISHCAAIIWKALNRGGLKLLRFTNRMNKQACLEFHRLNTPLGHSFVLVADNALNPRSQLVETADIAGQK